MRLGERMSAREIRNFFGLSSEMNVNQVFVHRAVKSMRRLKEKHG